MYSTDNRGNLEWSESSQYVLNSIPTSKALLSLTKIVGGGQESLPEIYKFEIICPYLIEFL